MGIFNEQSLDHPFARGIQGAPGVGFNLTSSGDYDMINKKLRNVGAPSANTDAATKKYVDDNSSGPADGSVFLKLDGTKKNDWKSRYGQQSNIKSTSSSGSQTTNTISFHRFEVSPRWWNK